MNEIYFPTDIHGRIVKEGDKVRGFGCLTFQDGWQIDLTPVVTVVVVNGVLYFGKVSAKSFRRFEIIEPKPNNQ